MENSDPLLMIIEATSAGFQAGNLSRIKINEQTVYPKKNENGHHWGLTIVAINSKTGKI